MTIIFYTTISLFKYVCVFICGGHHDSDRIAVLVMPVSKAENIVLYIIMYMYTCQNKDFLPPFPTISCIRVVSSRHGALGYRGQAGWSLPNQESVEELWY